MSKQLTGVPSYCPLLFEKASRLKQLLVIMNIHEGIKKKYRKHCTEIYMEAG